MGAAVGPALFVLTVVLLLALRVWTRWSTHARDDAPESPPVAGPRPRATMRLLVFGSLALLGLVAVSLWLLAPAGPPAGIQPPPPPPRSQAFGALVIGAGLIVGTLVLVFVVFRLERLDEPPFSGFSLTDAMPALVSITVLCAALALILSDSSQDNQKWAYGAIGSIVGHWLKASPTVKRPPVARSKRPAHVPPA